MTREDYEDLERLYSNSPEVIGDWGEIITASTLRDELGIRVLRTLYVCNSQIDMVGISQYGVFVIENKNYHGVVTGRVDATMWNVQYVPGGKLYQLYNPLLQNKKHKDAVKSMLSLTGYHKVNVYNTVIFNDAADLQLSGKCNHGHVYNLSDFVKVYMGVDVGRLVSETVVTELADLFFKYQDYSEEAKAAHIAMIHTSK